MTLPPDNRGNLHNIFLVSPQKHMLWVPIRSASVSASNEYPQHVFVEKQEKYQYF